MDVTDALKIVQKMGVGFASQAEHAEASCVLAAEVERLRAALRPFAEFGERMRASEFRLPEVCSPAMRTEYFRAAAEAMRDG